MKIVKIILWVVLAVAVVVVGALAYYGLFAEVSFSEKEAGGEVIVYKEVTGDYGKTAKVMDEIYYDLLENKDIETTRGFGIYYDNPQEVETEKLRSEAGCILPDKDTARIDELKEKYKVRRLPVQTVVTTEFPYKGTMSILVGIMKVYPALNKYMKSKSYSIDTFVMEIYDIPNKKTTYRMPVEK